MDVNVFSLSLCQNIFDQNDWVLQDGLQMLIFSSKNQHICTSNWEKIILPLDTFPILFGQLVVCKTNYS